MLFRRSGRLPLAWPLTSVTALLLLSAASAGAQQPVTPPAEPRKQWVTLSVERLNTLPLHFKDKPLEQLTGTDLGSAQTNQSVDYESRDGLTTVIVHEFRRKNRGAGITVYPLGAGNGAALAVRGSYEELPAIRFDINSPAGQEQYSFTDAEAYDVSVGVIVSDRSEGWGLGTHTILLGGIGRIRSGLGDGTRFVAEGGGGINVGPFGVELVIKFGYNRLDEPRPHNFLTVPITLRGTMSF